MDDDRKLIVVIIALWIVQAVFTLGSPLRTELETTLILSLVPGLDLFIEVLKLIGEEDVSSVWFYIKFFVILIKDALIAYLWEERRK